MQNGIVAAVMLLASGVALAQAPASSDTTPAAEIAQPSRLESDAPVAETAAPGLQPGEMENRLPPGFTVKRRGKYVLYCKSDMPIGTRFKKETCLDDGQMRDYLIWLQENKAEIDRIRQTCSNKRACGQPE